MSGSGYDQSVTTFSPEGRIYQVEYATKAVEISETVVGIRCKDGVLLAAEKQRFSRLLVDNSNRRINSLEAQIGVALVGKLPDARAILQRAKTEAADYLKNFAIPVTGSIITERLALFVHQFTVYGIGRPFGAAVLISSYNDFDGFQLHMVEPSGHSYAYYACAHGKGRSICKSEIERRNFREITCAEAYVHLTKMLILSHEEFKDKKFEYEITEISKNTGYQHAKLPQQVIDQAVAEAEKIIEQDQIGE